MSSKIKLVNIVSSLNCSEPYRGYRQVFIQLAGIAPRHSSQQYREVSVAGTRSSLGWVEINTAANHANQLLATPHHSINIIGKDPFNQVASLKRLLPLLSGRIMVSANGIETEALASILHCVHIIGIDINMHQCTFNNFFWRSFSSFLQLANIRETFVKINISDQQSDCNFAELINIIGNVDKDIPVILQTTELSNLAEVGSNPNSYLDNALHKIHNVRLLPL